MPIIDTRRVEFGSDALSIALEGCGPGLLGLPKERPQEIRCLALEGALQVRYAATGGQAHLVHGTELAALLIAYCRAVRIPLPIRATKSISVSESGVAMMMTIRHEHPPRPEGSDSRQPLGKGWQTS
jgi:hypothetical protein